jgi:SSS family transporter
MAEVDPTLMGALLIGYVGLQIGIGIYVARGVKSETDYFLAGRNLGMIPIALSIFATWFGAETVMGSSAAIAEGGLSGARAEPFGYALALLLMALMIAGAFRARGYITVADFFRERYGPRAEVLASVLSVIVSVIWASAQLLAFAVILKTTFDVPQTVTLIAATLIVVFYTSFSGLMGDIVTDMIQGAVLLIGLFLLFGAVASAFGGMGPMLATIKPQQLELLGPGETWLGQIDAWAIPVLGSLIAQEAISRILAARTPTLARNATFAAAGLYLAVGMIPVIIGLAGVHLAIAGATGDDFLPTLAQELLPPFLAVIFLGALLSAILSTVDSNLLSISSFVSVNILSKRHQRAGPTARLLMARVTTVCAGCAAALLAASGQSIYELISLTSVFGQAGILVAVLIGMNSKFGGAAAALAGMWACVAANIFTYVAWPLQAMSADGVSLGSGFGQIVSGEAPTLEGGFLLSIVVSVIAYSAGAWFDQRSERALTS